VETQCEHDLEEGFSPVVIPGWCVAPDPGQLCPLRSVHRGEGRTPQTVAEHAMPALKPSFHELERSADVFSWDAI